MKVFAVIALASVAVALPNCDIQAVDMCLTKVIPYANRTSVGATSQAIEEECKKDREAVKCLQDYAESGCLKGDALKAYRHLVSGVAGESALRCQPGTERYDEYLSYVPCTNKAGEGLNRCLRQTSAYIEAAKTAGGTGRLPQTCCSFTKLALCFDEAIGDKCDQKTIDYLRSVQKGIFGMFLDAQCGAYNLNSEKCKALPVLPAGEPKYTTLFGPLLEFLTSQ
ncbi:hypothetical protein BIW11_09146 [Tropilaelaps mercedesae]|uniref:Uncharacterized protein n=1 Tax=Tropilaelaps mercedesae TaxID=418985 RepID=A0A1V9XLL6_9ACAR|nr:hypothetical protein BIW11_09146 [Tropilaelaps mercedesae]